MTVPSPPASPRDPTEPRSAAPGAAQPGAAAPHGAARVVDDAPLIPDRSADDSDTGWHEGSDSNDERLLRDVPPHW